MPANPCQVLPPMRSGMRLVVAGGLAVHTIKVSVILKMSES